MKQSGSSWILVGSALLAFSCNRASPEPAPHPAPVEQEPARPTSGPGATGSSSGPSAPSGGSATGDNRVMTKPTVEVPSGSPPPALQTTDIIVGDGKEATPGSTVKVHYVGVTFSSHQEFDSSWKRAEPFEFPLGQGRVIAGWDQGVKGMKEGGRRRLVIPADMAYGANPPPGGIIGPNECLVFVVDLVKVSPAQ